MHRPIAARSAFFIAMSVSCPIAEPHVPHTFLMRLRLDEPPRMPYDLGVHQKAADLQSRRLQNLSPMNRRIPVLLLFALILPIIGCGKKGTEVKGVVVEKGAPLKLQPSEQVTLYLMPEAPPPGGK